MVVKFKITSKYPKKLSERLFETDLVHAGNIRYSICLDEVNETQVIGQIGFDPSYQPSDYILQEKAKMTLASQLNSFAFVWNDSYQIETFV